jgi:aerobic carbon-monoxide dehydrogenase medium subunit
VGRADGDIARPTCHVRAGLTAKVANNLYLLRCTPPYEPRNREGKIGTVKPSPFVHHAPRSVDEAVAVLAEVGHDGKVLAGGQSLIPILNMRLAAPGHLVDINRITGLDAVEVSADAVRIGALVRHAQLERHDGAFEHLPLLRQALRNVAHPVIRNRGTTVGSIAHADPSGEMPAVLALTGGYVEVASAAGTRTIAARDFFLGPLESSLQEGEMATGASFGRFPAGTGTAFAESARRHGDYALAGVAAAVTVVDGLVTAVRASFVSVTPTPDVLDLTELFAGQEVGDLDWGKAVDVAREHVDPDADIHATAEYRRLLVGVLTARVLAEAAAHASKA